MRARLLLSIAALVAALAYPLIVYFGLTRAGTRFSAASKGWAPPVALSPDRTFRGAGRFALAVAGANSAAVTWSTRESVYATTWQCAP